MLRFIGIQPCVELRLSILLIPALVLIFSACNSSAPPRPVSLPVAPSPDRPRLTQTEVLATLKTYLSHKPAEPNIKSRFTITPIRPFGEEEEFVSIRDCLHVIGNGRFASLYLGDGVWAVVFVPSSAAADPRVKLLQDAWLANPDPVFRDDLKKGFAEGLMQQEDPVAALNILIEVGSIIGVSMTKYVPAPIIDKITAPSVDMGSLQRVTFGRSTWLVFEDVPAVDVPRSYENPNAC